MNPFLRTLGKKIPEHSFAKNFQRINDDAGFGLSGRQRFFKSHALRKYFASTLHKNGLSQINIDWLLGHEIKGVNRSYIKADPSNLKEEYLRVVEDLSIAKVKVQMVTTEGFDELIRQLDEEKTEHQKDIEQIKVENKALKEDLEEKEKYHDAKMKQAMKELDEAMETIGEMNEKDMVRIEMNYIMLKAIKGKEISEEDKEKLKYLKNKLVVEQVD